MEMIYFVTIPILQHLKMNETFELHVFIDDCKKSYGACVFIRTVNYDEIKVQLIRAKSRVAPMKEMSLPKLELMA